MPLVEFTSNNTLISLENFDAELKNRRGNVTSVAGLQVLSLLSQASVTFDRALVPTKATGCDVFNGTRLSKDAKGNPVPIGSCSRSCKPLTPIA